MSTEPKTIEQSILAVTEDPTTSYWLRDAIVGLMERDPVDAANDADFLSDLMRERVAEGFRTAGVAIPDPPAPTVESLPFRHTGPEGMMWFIRRYPLDEEPQRFGTIVVLDVLPDTGMATELVALLHQWLQRPVNAAKEV